MLLLLSLRFPCPSSSLSRFPQNPNLKRIHCSSSDSDTPRADEGDGQQQQQRRSLLVERYQDGSSKRYILDANSHLQTVWEERGHSNDAVEEQHLSKLTWLPRTLKDFVLPKGYPGSVSDDYLDYMLLQLPTNVTGWVCHTLVTSSLLKAVGVGSFTGSSVAASAAAIRWVSKDGLGAIGRLFIGGRFGNLFDDDPKQWRMTADFIGSAGSIFELSTQLYPAYFLPLASLGNLAKATARGLKDPSFRVIQNHFAISGNLGEVAAKEEVWEVAAQILGLGLGIIIMDIPWLQTSYYHLAFTWLSIRLLHLWLRYQSLSVLKFNTINLKRARMLVKSHVLHHTVPGYVDCNKEENILSLERFACPRVIFGVSMEKMIGTAGSSHMSVDCKSELFVLGTPGGVLVAEHVKALVELYKKEKYILFVKQQGSKVVNYFVTFKVGATSLSVLKSLWQVHWLHEHWDRFLLDDVLSALEESLVELREGFNGFLRELEEAGWEKQHIVLKVPSDLLFEATELLDCASDI